MARLRHYPTSALPLAGRCLPPSAHSCLSLVHHCDQSKPLQQLRAASR